MVEPERVDKEGTKRGLAFDSCRFGLTDHNGDRGVPTVNTLVMNRQNSMIRTMVASGALTGDKVDAWKLKLEEEEVVAEMLRKAEAGDGRAMCVMVPAGVW